MPSPPVTARLVTRISLSAMLSPEGQDRLVGSKIVVAIKDEGYGGRGFACLDLEGHTWSVGSYDPWTAQR